MNLSTRAKALALALPIAGLCVVGCFDDDDDLGEARNGLAVATVRGVDPASNITGTVNFREQGDTVFITGEITGLAPGTTHGMHIHVNGDCADAGPHFAGPGEPHGDPTGPIGSHKRGQLPNITADVVGTAAVDFATTELRVRNGADRSVLNRSVMVHENPDDYTTPETGNAGAPIACGEIRAVNGGGTDTTGTGGGGGGGGIY